MVSLQKFTVNKENWIDDTPALVEVDLDSGLFTIGMEGLTFHAVEQTLENTTGDSLRARLNRAVLEDGVRIWEVTCIEEPNWQWEVIQWAPDEACECIDGGVVREGATVYEVFTKIAWNVI